MTQNELARAYLEKASKRIRVLEVLMEQDGFSDVAPEAQELVETHSIGAPTGLLNEWPRTRNKGLLRCPAFTPGATVELWFWLSVTITSTV